jgi:hypothetical protein
MPGDRQALQRGSVVDAREAALDELAVRDDGERARPGRATGFERMSASAGTVDTVPT